MHAQVVNRVEVDALANVGVPFFALNLAVGLSVALPGFREDITRGLLGAVPQVGSLIFEGFIWVLSCVI